MLILVGRRKLDTMHANLLIESTFRAASYDMDVYFIWRDKRIQCNLDANEIKFSDKWEARMKGKAVLA